MKFVNAITPTGRAVTLREDSLYYWDAVKGRNGWSLAETEEVSDKGEAPASPDSDPPARRRRKVRKHVAKDQG